MLDLNAIAAQVSDQLDADVISLRDGLVTLARYLQREFNVSRVTVWGVEGMNHQRTMRRAGGFDGVKEAAISEQATFVERQVKDYLATVSERGVFASRNTFADTLLSELMSSYLIPLDIRASLDGAVNINGELIAIFCFAQQSETRQWTSLEVDAVLAFARHVAILRARRLGRAGKSFSLMDELDRS